MERRYRRRLHGARVSSARGCTARQRHDHASGRARYARVNIALRLPRWIVGLDVDHYADKAGGDSLGDLQDKLGPLPGTFVSTARTDGVSGIRLFMLPGDYAASSWPSQAAPDIEMITWYERYVICSPHAPRLGNEYAVPAL